MERIEHLINKLVEQNRKGETPVQLLMTVQLLQQELSSLVQKSTAAASKISVVLPGSFNRLPQQQAPPTEKQIPLIPEQDRRFIPAEIVPVELIVSPEKKPVINPAPAYSIQKPIVATALEIEEEQSKEFLELTPHEPENEIINSTSERVPEKELHEIIAQKTESLNDKLKQQKPELVSSFKEVPIKDLRKGIGVNDKFLFINELFRGDEIMYERSIKTINGFRILQEAEYWMNRELKVKLGWNDSKETVQHFYAVVRRRFS